MLVLLVDAINEKSDADLALLLLTLLVAAVAAVVVVILLLLVLAGFSETVVDGLVDNAAVDADVGVDIIVVGVIIVVFAGTGSGAGAGVDWFTEQEAMLLSAAGWDNTCCVLAEL